MRTSKIDSNQQWQRLSKRLGWKKQTTVIKIVSTSRFNSWINSLQLLFLNQCIVDCSDSKHREYLKESETFQTKGTFWCKQKLHRHIVAECWRHCDYAGLCASTEQQDPRSLSTHQQYVFCSTTMSSFVSRKDAGRYTLAILNYWTKNDLFPQTSEWSVNCSQTDK